MKVININVDSSRRVPTHKGESFGSKTIAFRGVGARVPLGTGEVNPVVVGNRIQTTANGCATRSGGSVGVVISVVYVGMVVEILDSLVSSC